MRYEASYNGQTHVVDVERHEQLPNGAWVYVVTIDEVVHRVETSRPAHDVWSLLVNGVSLDAGVTQNGTNCDVEIVGVNHHVDITDPRKKNLTFGGLSSSGAVVTKMPGRIVRILVSTDDVVDKGQALIIVEAMKMENQLKASLPGVVSRICVTEGELVEANTTLMEIT